MCSALMYVGYIFHPYSYNVIDVSVK